MSYAAVSLWDAAAELHLLGWCVFVYIPMLQSTVTSAVLLSSDLGPAFALAKGIFAAASVILSGGVIRALRAPFADACGGPPAQLRIDHSILSDGEAAPPISEEALIMASGTELRSSALFLRKAE